ncbi:hypothetical protein LY78DRAFT_119189 [Colletotrichum sublineola]|nr:hypothetical protein LY78DRAFT_119189 [Colletotrichum sublineola]
MQDWAIHRSYLQQRYGSGCLSCVCVSVCVCVCVLRVLSRRPAGRSKPTTHTSQELFTPSLQGDMLERLQQDCLGWERGLWEVGMPMPLGLFPDRATAARTMASLPELSGLASSLSHTYTHVHARTHARRHNTRIVRVFCRV